mgnify:CR=1 FL=1
MARIRSRRKRKRIAIESKKRKLTSDFINYISNMGEVRYFEFKFTTK